MSRVRGSSHLGHDRGAVGLVLLAGIDLADRGRQLVTAEGLDQELARPGQHRAAQVVGLALNRHHHHRRGRYLRRETFGRRDAVHVGHVDVHEDDIGHQTRRLLDRLRTRRCRPDDLDVGLEPEQLC